MKHWFAVHTKPRQEKIAEENLRRQGFDIYFPQILVEKRRGERYLKIIEAMFPRYLFIHLAPGEDDVAPIQYTRGVSRLVRFGKELAKVPDEVIWSLKSFAKDHPLGAYVEVLPEPKPGDKVDIVNGCFSGLRGPFHGKSGEERVIVLLDILGEQNRVSLNRRQIELV